MRVLTCLSFWVFVPHNILQEKEDETKKILGNTTERNAKLDIISWLQSEYFNTALDYTVHAHIKHT